MEGMIGIGLETVSELPGSLNSQLRSMLVSWFVSVSPCLASRVSKVQDLYTG